MTYGEKTLDISLDVRYNADRRREELGGENHDECTVETASL